MIKSVQISGAGLSSVNGMYMPKSPSSSIPIGFKKTCDSMKWPVEKTWDDLSSKDTDWYLSTTNDSYMYLNARDGTWWIDEPSGAGAFIALDKGNGEGPPASGWRPLDGIPGPVPEVEIHTEGELREL